MQGQGSGYMLANNAGAVEGGRRNHAERNTMPEFQAVVIENSTPAEEAVQYVLQRVIHDRDYSWYMWGTETLRRCFIAEGARRGVPDSQIEAETVQASLAADERLKRHGADRARVRILDEKLDALEEKICDLQFEGELPEELAESLLELIR